MTGLNSVILNISEDLGKQVEKKHDLISVFQKEPRGCKGGLP